MCYKISSYSCFTSYENKKEDPMVKKNYKMKKTISMKMFIAELGKNFSKHMKERLLELEVRCVLTRKQENILDLKHVEHTQYNCNLNSGDILSIQKKEYAYGQFIVIDDALYFSDKCLESDSVMQSPIVNTIFNSLKGEVMYFDEDIKAKKIDDSNIDYIINSILSVCPQVSQSYIDIVKSMLSHEGKNKKLTFQ